MDRPEESALPVLPRAAFSPFRLVGIVSQSGGVQLLRYGHGGSCHMSSLLFHACAETASVSQDVRCFPYPFPLPLATE